jgi:hypothetical protein
LVRRQPLERGVKVIDVGSIIAAEGISEVAAFGFFLEIASNM